MDTSKPHWINEGCGNYSVSQGGPATLPAGVYRLVATQRGVFWRAQSVVNDNLFDLPDAPMELVLDEIKTFWTLTERFVARGLLHKRGALLYGPAGSGKTATLALLGQHMTRQGGITVYLEQPSVAVAGLQMMRQQEPKRPIVAIIEDIDEYDAGDWLQLLDGGTQIDGIVYLATTNHPERLEPRLLDRPSRFDLVIEIGMPTAAARHEYLQRVEPSLTEYELRDWVRATDGYSIAHLRELIVLCRCYGKSLAAALQRLNTQRGNAEKILQKAAVKT